MERTNEELLDAFEAALSEFLEKPNNTYESEFQASRAVILARFEALRAREAMLRGALEEARGIIFDLASSRWSEYEGAAESAVAFIDAALTPAAGSQAKPPPKD